jgi:hypothetical protein
MVVVICFAWLFLHSDVASAFSVLVIIGIMLMGSMAFMISFVVFVQTSGDILEAVIGVPVL